MTMQPSQPYYPYGFAPGWYAHGQPAGQGSTGTVPWQGQVGLPQGPPLGGYPTDGTTPGQQSSAGPVGQSQQSGQSTMSQPATQGAVQQSGQGAPQQPSATGGVQAGPAEQARQQASPVSYVPLVDVYEHPSAIEVVVDLPGFEEDDIQLNADTQTLHVSAERPADTDEERVAVQRERPTHIERAVTIPVHVELEEASAVYEAGVCRVTLPKSDSDVGTQTKIGFH